MSFEQDPTEGVSSGSYFEIVAASQGLVIQQKMDIFVTSDTVRRSDIFGPFAAQIDDVSSRLAHAMVGYEVPDRDIASLQACFRVGLQLARELSGDDEGTMSLLDKLELLCRHPKTVAPMVNGSYDRYLKSRRNVLEYLRDNLQIMAPRLLMIPGQNIVSYVLEQADNATLEHYIAQQSDPTDLDRQIADLLDNPPNTD